MRQRGIKHTPKRASFVTCRTVFVPNRIALYMMTPLPSPEEFKSLLPASAVDLAAVAEWRKTVVEILSGKDRRLLIIIGPCAIHCAEAALEYASRLRSLSEELSDRLFIVMRTYIEKSRSGPGWKGFLYSHPSMQEGLKSSRQLFLSLLRLGLPTAMEFLGPLTSDYFSDLVTWGCIGARTVQSSLHRELASRLPMPVGMKNSPDGSIEAAIHGVKAARCGQTCLALNSDGRICTLASPGNRDAHLVLRGGQFSPNFYLSHVQRAAELLREAGLPGGIVVDCSHGNSQRRHESQPAIFHEVFDEALRGSPVRGLMVESFLLDGRQQDLLAGDLGAEEREKILYGASSVDGCLGWEASEALLRSAYVKAIEVSSCVL